MKLPNYLKPKNKNELAAVLMAIIAAAVIITVIASGFLDIIFTK